MSLHTRDEEPRTSVTPSPKQAITFTVRVVKWDSGELAHEFEFELRRMRAH